MCLVLQAIPSAYFAVSIATRGQRENETETHRFSINQKPTDSRFLQDHFLVNLILVGFGFHAAITSAKFQ
jgi:hypothetical protein